MFKDIRKTIQSKLPHKKNWKKLKHQFRLNANQRTLASTLLIVVIIISVLGYFGYREVGRLTSIRRTVSQSQTALGSFLLTNESLKEAISDYSKNASEGKSTTDSTERVKGLLNDLKKSAETITESSKNIETSDINDYKISLQNLSPELQAYVQFETQSFQLITLYNEIIFTYLSAGESLNFQKPTNELVVDFDNLSKRLIAVSTVISGIITEDDTLSLFKTSTLNLSNILSNYCTGLSQQFASYNKQKVETYINETVPKITAAEGQVSSNLQLAQNKEDELNNRIADFIAQTKTQYDRLQKDYK